MNGTSWRYRLVTGFGAALFSGLLAGPAVANDDFDYHVSGYLREYIGIKLQNSPDILYNGKKLGGAGEINMARSVIRLDLDARYRKIRIKAIARAVHETIRGWRARRGAA